MIHWLRRFREGLRAWLKSNAQAHANATPHSCCSAPPPGAGGHGDHRSGK